MNTEQYVGTTQAGANVISDEEYFATIDDDDDVMMTDDITPDMLTDDVVEAMRWWLADCTLPDGYEASSMDTDEVISFVTNGYEGGIPQFLADGVAR